MSEYIMQCTTDMDGIDCYVHTGVLIRCKDCRWNDGTAYCEFHYRDVEEDSFCSWAERKKE